MTSWFSLTAVEWSALILSLKVACCAVLMLIPLGICCGWLLARRHFWGKPLLDALIHLPLVVPPVVVGYLLLLSFSKGSFLGGWLHSIFGVEIAFSWYAAVIASGIMGFPLLVRSVRLAIELVDVELELAASSLGAGPLRIFWTITLPLASPGIMTGILLAFARSLGEFGATITFAGNIEGETRTLPLAIFSMTQLPGEETSALRLVILSIILSLLALALSNFFSERLQKKIGKN